MSVTKKVLLIGWDAADWKIILPLVRAGKMPNMAQFLSEGVSGNLATLYPILSPMLWTSIATGKRAYKHGVHGFSEPDPDRRSVRPITNLARKTKAVWNILNQSGKQSNVIGWWPTHPAEPINGVMVSDLYQKAHHSLNKPWPLRSGTIHPPHLSEALEAYRVHPGEISGDQIRMFVPQAHEVEQEKDKRLESVARIIAETASIHAAATATMQLEPWDFMGVYSDAIDHFGHGFMKYHPPRSPWISEADFALYQHVIESAYRYHDAMLGVLLQLAGEDTVTIVVSDHGFHPDRLRPQFIPNEPAGPAAEHRPFGIVAMKGPGIRRGAKLQGACLLDIAPTVLQLFGLPVGRDMDGRVLSDAFEATPTVRAIASWDEEPGESAMHPPAMRADAEESQAAMEHLVELGYVEALDADLETQIAETARELKYNLARSYTGAERHWEAIPLFEELWETWPDEGRFGVHLFQAFLALDRLPEARQTLEKLRERKAATMEKARQELQTLQDSLQDKDPKDFTKAERYKLRKLTRRAGANQRTFAFLSGSLLAAEGNHDRALELLAQVEDVQTNNLPSLYDRMGQICSRKRDWSGAEAYFRKVLALDDAEPHAMGLLSYVCLRQHKYQEAADLALGAFGLIFQNPAAHFYCGVALTQLGQVLVAEQEFQTAIAQNRTFAAAYRWLARLYAGPLDRPEQATVYRQLAREAYKHRCRQKQQQRPQAPSEPQAIDWAGRLQRPPAAIAPLTAPLNETIVVVSGLPRSGTSMMMQMLAKGGIPLLSDGTRQADASNPRGYYEFEPVKQLWRDRSWLTQAQGKAVKIIAQLLPNLAPGYHYRIIFMERHLKEVLASQQAMLGRQPQKMSDAQLAGTYLQQLSRIERFLGNSPTVASLHLSYEAVIGDPTVAARQLNEFLGGSLEERAAIEAVAPDLHHQKACEAAPAV